MKVMLASPLKGNVSFPVYVSPKIDGVRAVILNGKVMSRSMKPIPNKYVQKLFGKPEYDGLDGELVVGRPNLPDTFRKTTSGVMSKEGEPDVYFYVFDDYSSPSDPFYLRLASILSRFNYDIKPEYRLIPVKHITAYTYEEINVYEEQYLNQGYEGIMLRSPHGPYKFGRSTSREGYLLKVKRFLESDAEILEVVEEMHNTNKAVRNAAGNLERSTAKAGLVGKGRAGALIGRDIHTGVEVRASGFTDQVADFLWAHRNTLVGEIFKYQYFPHGGKDKPRHPIYLGIRDKRDIS